MSAPAELTIGPEPDAVPRARRLARAALTDQPPDVAGDAELVVSELVTNAALHGAPPITVRVTVQPRVRVEVEDRGRSAPILLKQNTETMTGRGLSMVAAVARDWGVEPSPDGGKVVWAELGGSPAPRGPGPEVDIDALLASWPDDDTDGTVTVGLGAVSTDLLLAAKAHIDNVVRELVLLREGEASSGVALAPETAALVETVTSDFAEVRAQIKRLAAGAAARGEALTNLQLQLDPTLAAAGERYLDALDRADRFARSAHLLTLAPPKVHRLFRQWYVRAIIDQLRAHAAGEPVVPARPFALVLAEEVARLSEEAATSARLSLLQKVAGELVDSTSPDEMALTVADRAIQLVGVESVQVWFLTEEGRLRSIAHRGGAGGDDRPVEGIRLEEMPLEADHPVAVVARTGAAKFVPSQPGPPPAADRSDVLPPGHSSHTVPLVSGARLLGVLGLTFLDGELTAEAQTGFAEALGDSLASAMRRAQLSASETAQRETLSFLAAATQILISTSEPDEVVERLVTLAVPRLGDWCTVYLADGAWLRREAMAIDGFPELADRLSGSVLSIDEDSPHTRAFRTGQVQYITGHVGRLLERLYPGLDFSALGGDPDAGTGVCVPLVLRDRIIGVVAATFVRSRRQLTRAMVEAVTGLAARAAIALDNAQRWDEQRRIVRSLVEAVLPDEPPVVPGVQFAARYRPAAGDVAGDWWEVDATDDEAVLVGLGDAAGHGLPAVSRMSELRHGARALAVVERSPAAILEALNHRMSAPDTGFATAVYGRLKPESGEVIWASAGHVPPLHLHTDGHVTVLDDRPGAPLGSPVSDSARDRCVILEAGESLIFYSDGVVERRSGGVDPGVARLVAAVEARTDLGVSALADAIIGEVCGEPTDDCCVLVIRRSPH